MKKFPPKIIPSLFLDWKRTKDRPMMGALDQLAPKPQCRILDDKICVHWWRVGAKPGDKCACGKRRLTKSADMFLTMSYADENR